MFRGVLQALLKNTLGKGGTETGDETILPLTLEEFVKEGELSK